MPSSSFFRRVLPLIIWLTTASITTCSAANGVAYTSLGAQVYLDTIDPATGTINKRVPIGQNGTSLAIDTSGTPYTFSPDGKTAYIAGQNLEAIDVATGASLWQVPDVYPPSLATSADGSRLYVSDGGSNLMNVYDAATGQLSQSVPLPDGYYGQILVKPDDSKIYLSGYGVVVLNGSTYQLMTTLFPRSISESMALSPSGTRLYVGGNDILPNIASVVDTSSDQVIAQVGGSGLTSAFGQLTLTPDGKTLLFANSEGLAEASTETNKVTAIIPFTKVFHNDAVLIADNHFAYYPEIDNPGLYRFDLAALTVTRIEDGGLVVDAARRPDGKATLLQTLNAILTSSPATGEILSELGRVPGNRSLALSGDGNTLVGTSEDGPNLNFSVIDTATHAVTKVAPLAASGINSPYPVISFDGATAYYVSTYYPVAYVSAVDLSTGLVTGTFTLPFTYGSGWDLAISPDGSAIYATTLGLMASGTCRVSVPAYVVGPCILSGSPSALSRPMAVSPDGSKLYQPDADGGLSELDTQTLALLRTISGTLPDLYASNVLYSAAANSVYVATLNGASSLVSRVDLDSFQIAATQSLTFPPVDLAVTPDGTEVLVVGGPSGTTVLDGITLTPSQTIKTGVTQSIVIASQ